MSDLEFYFLFFVLVQKRSAFLYITKKGMYMSNFTPLMRRKLLNAYHIRLLAPYEISKIKKKSLESNILSTGLVQGIRKKKKIK